MNYFQDTFNKTAAAIGNAFGTTLMSVGDRVKSYGEGFTKSTSTTKFNSDKLNSMAHNSLVKCLTNDPNRQDMLSLLYDNSNNFNIFFNDINIIVAKNNNKLIKGIELQIDDFNRYVRFINILVNYVKISDLNESHVYEFPVFKSETGFIFLDNFELFDDSSFLENYKDVERENKYFIVFENSYFENFVFIDSNSNQNLIAKKRFVVFSFALNEANTKTIKEYESISTQPIGNDNLSTFPLNLTNIKRYSFMNASNSFMDNKQYITNKVIRVDDQNLTNEMYYVSMLIDFDVYIDEKDDLYNGENTKQNNQAENNTKQKAIIKYNPIMFIDKEYNSSKLIDLVVRKNVLKSTIFVLDPLIMNLYYNASEPIFYAKKPVFNDCVSVVVDENSLTFEMSVIDCNVLIKDAYTGLLEFIDPKKNAKVLITTKNINTTNEEIQLTKLEIIFNEHLKHLIHHMSLYNIKSIDGLINKIKNNYSLNVYFPSNDLRVVDESNMVYFQYKLDDLSIVNDSSIVDDLSINYLYKNKNKNKSVNFTTRYQAFIDNNKIIMSNLNLELESKTTSFNNILYYDKYDQYNVQRRLGNQELFWKSFKYSPCYYGIIEVVSNKYTEEIMSNCNINNKNLMKYMGLMWPLYVVTLNEDKSNTSISKQRIMISKADLNIIDGTCGYIMFDWNISGHTSRGGNEYMITIPSKIKVKNIEIDNTDLVNGILYMLPRQGDLTIGNENANGDMNLYLISESV